MKIRDFIALGIGFLVSPTVRLGIWLHFARNPYNIRGVPWHQAVVAAVLLSFFCVVHREIVPTAVAGLHDMVEVSVTGNPGTGTFTLGATVSPFVGPAAGGVTSGETVTYAAQDTAGNWERGRGVWTSGGTNGTLTRAVVLLSTNSNALVNFSVTSPTVWITLAAEDAVTTVYPNIELSLNSQPLCPLTDAATVLVAAGPTCASDATKGIAYDSLTLTANGHILGCPTGATTSGSGVLFRINEGTGPFKISPAGCYYFPNTGALDGQGNLVLSGITNGIDQFYCELQGVSTGNGFPVQYECGAILTGLGSASVYVNGTPTSTNACSSGITSCASASTTLTAGDIVQVIVDDCGNNTNCTSGTLVGISSITSSPSATSGCAAYTNAEGAFGGIGIHQWYCTVTATGATVLTVNFASTVNFPSIVLVDLHNAAASPDAGIGHFASGTGTAVSDTTNGNVQQSDSYIISLEAPQSGSVTVTPGAGLNVVLTLNSVQLVQSSIPYSPGATATHTATFSGSTPWVMSIVEVLHK